MQVVIGSRGSRLALWQARHVQAEIERRSPEARVRVEIIKTTGDKMTEVALARIGGKGVFVKEIEEALLEGRIDLAVHSLKDVPTELPEGLILGAIPPREDPRDALVGAVRLESLGQLRKGAEIGTGSLRRSVQLRRLRQDLKVTSLRGNVDTRLRKMEEQGMDGVVLAMAGLNRLGLADRVAYVFPPDEMTPAIGQGALAIEIRGDNDQIRKILKPLEHAGTRRCVEQERLFLHQMGGGCQVPMGAHASIENGTARFSAFVAGPASGRLARKTAEGPSRKFDDLRQRVVDHLMDNGAAEMLAEMD